MKLALIELTTKHNISLLSLTMVVILDVFVLFYSMNILVYDYLEPSKQVLNIVLNRLVILRLSFQCIGEIEFSKRKAKKFTIFFKFGRPAISFSVSSNKFQSELFITSFYRTPRTERYHRVALECTNNQYKWTKRHLRKRMKKGRR